MPLWGHLLCAAAAAATLAAAGWQHQRAGQKQLMQDAAEQRLDAPPLAAAQLADTPAAELRWRRAAAAGSYDPTGQFLLDNRVLDGRPGFHVIAPLQLEGDLWILVNRGFLAAEGERSRMRPPPLAAAPGAPVTVTGILDLPGRQALKLEGPAAEGLIWQRIDLDLWQQRTGRQALPAVLLAAEAGDPRLSPVAVQPDFRAATSRGYRLQWLLLCAVVIAGWLRVTRVFKRGES